MKKGSSPPVCGVHGVPLVKRRTTEEPFVTRVGDFTYLACPVSDQVVS